MENSLYVGLSGQVALEAKMALVANNVANLNTPGYRGQNMVFKEFISDQRNMKADVSLVYDYGQYDVTDPGPIKSTGNALDVALVGPGFIGIQTPQGVQYTRGGNFSINALGELVTARGFKVANEGGGTITIPAEARFVTIGENGSISTDQGIVDAIMISEFEHYQKLEPQGNGLYATDDPAIPATGTKMLQGKLEGSNVSAVVEMTRMIDLVREYQAIQNAMQNEHDRQQTAIQRILRNT
ncbi:MAG: flagellar basal-body rod protein FlgF [Micavibrio sp.]